MVKTIFQIRRAHVILNVLKCYHYTHERERSLNEHIWYEHIWYEHIFTIIIFYEKIIIYEHFENNVVFYDNNI